MRNRNLGLLGAALIVVGFALHIASGVVAANVTDGHRQGPAIHHPGGGVFGPGGSGQPGNRR